MLTKTFQKDKKKRVSVWPRERNNQNLKEIRKLGTQIIATRTDEGQKSHTMTSTERVKQSRANKCGLL